MKRILTLITFVLVLTWQPLAIAGTAHQGHDDKAQSEELAHTKTEGIYTHQVVVDGIRVEFQVMSLASMNMKDPEGNTHHIMVKFSHDGMNHEIDNVVGKIKVITPSGKEQIGSLKNYSGIYAANFTFSERGKYGVICLFKVAGEKHLVKFWYPHS